MLGLGGAIPAAVWEKAAVFSRRRGAVRTRKEARSEKIPGRSPCICNQGGMYGIIDWNAINLDGG